LENILGRFAYCSVCGTRNNLSEFEDVILPAIREDLNRGGVTSASNVSLPFKIKVGKVGRLTMISNVCDRFPRILGSEDFFILRPRAHDVPFTVDQI
jgi:hypothetical protein